MSYVIQVEGKPSRLPIIKQVDMFGDEEAEVLLPSDTIGFQMITHAIQPTDNTEYILWNFEGVPAVVFGADNLVLPFGEHGGVMGLKLRENQTLYLNSSAPCTIELIIFLVS